MDSSRIKIQDYKKSFEPAEFTKYSQICNSPPLLTNSQEQNRMLEKFEQLHWKTDKLGGLKSHRDKMFCLQEEQAVILGQQKNEGDQIQAHRELHLQRIFDHIQTSRETFQRQTELERPGNKEKQQSKNLFKICNNGTL